MAQLQIRYSGIVALTPGWPREADSLTRPGPLYAVMPSATRQNRRSPPVPIHFPVMLTRANPRTDGDYRPPDESVNGWNIWYPLRERLEFLLDDDTKPGTLEYQRDPEASNPNLPDGDIDYLADMREVWPEKSTILPEMLDKGGAKPAPLQVAAQVIVPRGKVTSDTGAKQKFRVKFVPEKTHQIVRKVVAAEALLTTEAKTVHIACFSLDTGEELAPIGFDLNNDTEIRVGNADAGDIHNTIYGDQSATTTMPGPDDIDFGLYYRILGADSGPIPVLDGMGIEIGGRPCVVVMLD